MMSERKEKDGSNDKLEIPGIPFIPKDKIEEGLKWLDKYIEGKFKTMLESEKAEIAKSVSSIIGEEVPKAVNKAIGELVKAYLPLATPPTESAEQNIQNSQQINPAFLQLLSSFIGGGKSEMDRLADTITKARAIADALNPPTIWDKVFPQIVVRAFMKAGLLTEHEGKEIEKSVSEKGD